MKRQPRSSPRSAKPRRTVSIIGTGSYVPEKILTNADLSRMVDTIGRVDHHPHRH